MSKDKDQTLKEYTELTDKLIKSHDVDDSFWFMYKAIDILAKEIYGAERVDDAKLVLEMSLSENITKE